MPPRKFTDQEEREIAKIYQSGVSARAIARAYGLSHHTAIVAALRRCGVTQRTPSERNRLYHVNSETFDIIDTQEKAYWWGFLYADGCVHHRSVTVALKRGDQDHIEKLRKFLKAEHPIKQTIRNSKHKVSQITVTEKRLANKLRGLGIVVGRDRFPSAIKHLPVHLRSHWLRGYFDGDGHLAKNYSKLSFVSNKEDVIDWLKEVLFQDISKSLHPHTFRHKYSNSFYLEYRRKDNIALIGKYLYKNASVFLERKQKLF